MGKTPRPRAAAGLVALLLLVFVQVTAPAAAQDQMQIIQTAIAPEGYVTEDMHARFWQGVDPGVLENAQALEAFVGVLDTAVVTLPRYDREHWLSVAASLQAGAVEHSPGYEAAKAALLGALPAPQHRQNMAAHIDNAERLQHAAATGEQVEYDGNLVDVTPALIERQLSNLDAILVRTQLLFDPSWDPQPQMRRYESAGVGIRSTVPFIIRSNRQAMGGTLEAETAVLGHRVDAALALFVSLVAYNEPTVEPARHLALAATRVIERTIGVTPEPIETGAWRGRPAVQTRAATMAAGGTASASVLAVAKDDDRQILIFMAVSTRSPDEAEQQRVALEEATELLD